MYNDTCSISKPMAHGPGNKQRETQDGRPFLDQLLEKAAFDASRGEEVVSNIEKKIDMLYSKPPSELEPLPPCGGGHGDAISALDAEMHRFSRLIPRLEVIYKRLAEIV